MPEKIHLTRSDIKQYGMSPVGVVTPMYIGQYCITDDNKVYFANGLTSNDWIEASGNNDALDEILNEINSLSGEIGDCTFVDGIQSENLTDAINELFQDVDSGKQLIATAIDSSNVTKDSTFSAMSETIKSYKNNLYNTMINKNFKVDSSYNFENLINLLNESNISIEGIKKISCGNYHVMILKNDGSLWACGYNNSGQLGLGDTTNRTIFTQVDVSNVKEVYCGNVTTFIIKNDGTLWSTGNSNNGQLGLGLTETIVTKFTLVEGITDIKQVECRDTYTILIKNDGSYWGCGRNSNGQLGDIPSLMSVFTKSTTMNNVKEVAYSAYHNFGLILKNDGTLWGVGVNDTGQLGLGHSNDTSSFTQVPNMYDIKQINCGVRTSFVLKNDNTLWYSGATNHSEVIDSSFPLTTTFAQALTNVNYVASSGSAVGRLTFLIKDDGYLYCCGTTMNGCFGMGDSELYNIPLTKLDVNDIKQISLCQDAIYILKNNDNILVCGQNNRGQLGTGNTSNKYIFTNLGLNISSASLNLILGEKITITATKLHPSIIGKNIIWRADNVENHAVTEICTINENGVLTTRYHGTTNIHAICGEYIASCLVNIEP